MKRDLNAARLAAVKEMHAEVTVGLLDSGNREALAAKIRALKGLSRAPRWDQAAEAYAALIEEIENPVPWGLRPGQCLVRLRGGRPGLRSRVSGHRHRSGGQRGAGPG